MKTDLRKYVPDVARVLEESHPDKVKARRRKALEKLREEGLIERLTPEPEPELAESALGSAPTDEPGPYEVPEAAPDRAVTRDAARTRAEAQRRRTRMVFVGFMIIAIAAPLTVVLAGRSRDPRRAASAPASASAQASAAPSAPASVAPATPASSGAGPVAPASSAEPSAAPTASAAPSVTAVHHGPSRPHRQRKHRPTQQADAGKPAPDEDIW